MFVARQMDRDFRSGDFRRIICSCMEMRPEGSVRLSNAIDGPIGAAAVALVRLEELSQGHHPLAPRLIRALISTQERDGGWGDVALTVLCVKALTSCRGHGVTVDRGIAYLAQLQRADGDWPSTPFRRMAGDPFVTALIVQQLGEDPRFIAATRVEDALNWLVGHEAEMDIETERLWKSLRRRRPTPMHLAVTAA